MRFQTVTHIDLSAEQKSSLGKIMAKGSNVLKAYWEKVCKKVDGPYSRPTFRTELFKLVDSNATRFCIRGIQIPKEAVDAILEIRKIESQVIAGYSKWISTMAIKWSRMEGRSTSLTFEDFYQEISMKMTDVMYCYNKTENQFITFAHRSIKNGMLKVANESKSIRWTNENRRLVGEYHKAKNKINGPVDFDQLTKIMKLDDKQKEALSSCLTKMVNQSEMTASGSGEEAEMDYSQFGINQSEASETLDFDQKEAVKNARLDAWEKAVLAAFLEAPYGSHGWQTEVAAANINPLTGKQYSRAAPAIALKRIREKILAQYKKAA